MNSLIPVVLGMLLTGTCNTLLNKYQDFVCVSNCDGTPVLFEQPLLQTFNMFIGETICLFIFILLSSRDIAQPISSTLSPTGAIAKPQLRRSAQLLLLIPTLCDLTSTTLMNIGLLTTSASIYQMLRGSVVIFTAILSTAFLKIHHPAHKWLSLGIIFVGVVVVGLSSLDTSKSDESSFVGIGLIVLAQSFTAVQFVIEEKLFSYYDLQVLHVVGLEGIFGLSALITMIPVLHYFFSSKSEIFNVYAMVHAMTLPNIWIPSIGICISIALFNWCGLIVTRSVSATARSTIDTCRTLFIWLVSMIIGWEKFSFTELGGFVILLYGTFLFNDVVVTPVWMKRKNSVRLEQDDEEVVGLLQE